MASTWSTSDGLQVFSVVVDFSNITQSSATATVYLRITAPGIFASINANNVKWLIKRSTGSPSNSGTTACQGTVYGGDSYDFPLGSINLTGLSANTTYTVHGEANTGADSTNSADWIYINGEKMGKMTIDVNFKTAPSTITYSSHVNINGSWKTINTAYVNVNGVWKTVSAIYVKDGNSWKRAK